MLLMYSTYFAGAKYWKYADPIGAIVISIYIIISWFITGIGKYDRNVICIKTLTLFSKL